MSDTRKLIAILILGIWGVTLFICLGLIIFDEIGLDSGLTLLAQISGVTSGFVGIIIGYYFTNDK